MDSLLTKELTSLQSEKKMGDTEIKSSQSRISEQLRGAMGKDMLDVLEGRKEIKKIKVSMFSKLKSILRNVLIKINGNGQ